MRQRWWVGAADLWWWVAGRADPNWGGSGSAGYRMAPMSRRIEIELTSVKDDETWTWRAVGAREPKGVIAASLLPEGAAVGQELRVEAAARSFLHHQVRNLVGTLKLVGEGKWTADDVAAALAKRDRAAAGGREAAETWGDILRFCEKKQKI